MSFLDLQLLTIVHPPRVSCRSGPKRREKSIRVADQRLNHVDPARPMSRESDRTLDGIELLVRPSAAPIRHEEGVSHLVEQRGEYVTSSVRRRVAELEVRVVPDEVGDVAAERGILACVLGSVVIEYGVAKSPVVRYKIAVRQGRLTIHDIQCYVVREHTAEIDLVESSKVRSKVFDFWPVSMEELVGL